jgi:hypothetical protein
MVAQNDPTAVRAYYRSALAALSYLEHRQPTGRRFGRDADARWANFKGDLVTADRIDLMIRDADAQWPASFAARVVFNDDTVSEDDPFGPAWAPLPPIDAEEIWRGALSESTPQDIRATLSACARAWDLSMEPHEVGAVRAADRIVAAGPSAIAALVDAFAGNRDLDWADQVVVVATPPAHRQLAALATALLNAAKPSTIHTPSDGAALRGGRRVILSQDASADDAACARALSAGA